MWWCITDFKQTSIKIHLIDNTCELQSQWSVTKLQPTFLEDRAGTEAKPHLLNSRCTFAEYISQHTAF